jgi:hypothetical protein
VLVLGSAALLLVMQTFGSYTFIRNVFRWLALTLLAYVASAILSKPEPLDVLKGTVIPRLHVTQDFLAILVAVIGTTLSAYLYTWQSNEEVEEEIALGRRRLPDRVGATSAELKRSFRDIVIGMFFSKAVMFFVLCRHRRDHRDRGRHEFPECQSDESARLVRHGAGILHAAADAVDHVDHQRPSRHGGVGQRARRQPRRLAHHRRDLRRVRRTYCHVDHVAGS